jgi:hypothetical protein
MPVGVPDPPVTTDVPAVASGTTTRDVVLAVRPEVVPLAVTVGASSDPCDAVAIEKTKGE